MMRLGPQANRVYEMLKHRITTGSLSADDRLPANMELASQYGVALVTVRHALARLRREGLVSSKQGVGTFVREGGGEGPKAVLIISDSDLVPAYLSSDEENAPCQVMHVTDAIANLSSVATAADDGVVFISVNLLRNEDSKGLVEALLAAVPKALSLESR